MEAYSSLLLKKVKAHLKKGGVIAYPTESCYGFGCDPYNYKAINKVIKIKSRSKSKGLIVIARSLSQLDKLIILANTNDIDELKQYWPGFYSIILPANKRVLFNLNGRHQKIAVRVTKCELVRQLCYFVATALVSTSANKSGNKPIKSYRECKRQFGDKVMVLPGKIGFAKRQSTIIDWQTKNKLR